jgi:hypothetical protein
VCEIVERITGFLESVGLSVRCEEIPEPMFLPGVEVRHGVLIFDSQRLLYPGDLLHEAGHLAVMSASERTLVHGPLGDDGALEMSAIAWSWAAALEIGLAPSVVFHADGYKGGSDSIVENFMAGRYFGVPMLEFTGLRARASIRLCVNGCVRLWCLLGLNSPPCSSSVQPGYA